MYRGRWPSLLRVVVERWLLFGKYSSIKGSIVADKENHEAEFRVNSPILSIIDPCKGFLFLLGDGKSGEGSRKRWGYR